MQTSPARASFSRIGSSSTALMTYPVGLTTAPIDFVHSGDPAGRIVPWLLVHGPNGAHAAIRRLGLNDDDLVDFVGHGGPRLKLKALLAD